MEHTYQDFLKKGIDLVPLGLEKSTEDQPYFCTPKGARIIGWAGVDGIHYCFIQGFGEMVFAVSPMNIAPHYVHPLACNFSDFLRLLLACGHCAALDQAWQWDEAQFKTFLRENPTTAEQKTVLDQIAAQTGLSPMEDPWQYLHELQSSFDYRKIKYTKAFYDPDRNPDAPRQAPEWKVTFCGDFWGQCGKGQAGKELAIRREFTWAGHHWLIPSIYLCGKGLVVDFCMEIAPADIRAFMKKWGLGTEHEAELCLSQEQQMQMELDDPLGLDFDSVLCLNGKELHADHGFGASYNPCLPSEFVMDCEGKRVVSYYDLDSNVGWMIWRSCYPWATKRKPEIRSLSITMIQEKISLPGPHFRVNRPGDTVPFAYGGQEYRLTVQAYEARTIDMSRISQGCMEYPNHCSAMSYTITPEPPAGAITLSDCDGPDLPRPKSEPEGTSDTDGSIVVSCICVPTATAGKQPDGLQTVCSSLHFQPVEKIEWRMVFHETQFENTTVDLLPS